MFIVWTEDHDGNVTAERENTKRAAVMAYNKLTDPDHNLKGYGWTVSEDGDPKVRRAVGLKPFLSLGEKD